MLFVKISAHAGFPFKNNIAIVDSDRFTPIFPTTSKYLTVKVPAAMQFLFQGRTTPIDPIEQMMVFAV